MTNEPTTPPSFDLEQVSAELSSFRAGFSTLLMATVDAAGEPEASYAAFVEQGGDFHVFVSELSVHTENLASSRRASVLFIEDEASAAHPFARRRLTYQCEAEELARGTPQCDALLDRFEARFGALIGTLRGLADFRLFRLRPRSARYVSGFGKAFVIDDMGLGEIRHLRGGASRSEDPEGASPASG